MSDKHLCYDDHSKILQFMDEMQVSSDYFQMHVLSLLEKIFGFSKISFWLSDEFGNVHNPASTEGGHFVNAYLDQNLSEIHSLNPQNVGIAHAVGKRVLYNNFSTTAVIHEQKDYHDFMCEYGYFREAVVYLSHGNKLIGCLGIGRTECEDDFSSKEVALLSQLSKYISRGLYNNQLFYNKEYEKKIFEMFADESATGFLICDAQLNIHYSNKSSFEICSELVSSTKKPIESFLSTVLAESRLLWKTGHKNYFYTPSLKKVNITMVPTTLEYNITSGKDFFIVMLSYQDVKPKNNFGHIEQKQFKPLSIRERQILDLIIQGNSNREIADELYISIHTVKKHIQALFKKFNARNRTSLIFAVSEVLN